MVAALYTHSIVCLWPLCEVESHFPTVNIEIYTNRLLRIGDLDTIGSSAVERFHNKLACMSLLPTYRFAVFFSSQHNSEEAAVICQNACYISSSLKQISPTLAINI